MDWTALNVICVAALAIVPPVACVMIVFEERLAAWEEKHCPWLRKLFGFMK